MRFKNLFTNHHDESNQITSIVMPISHNSKKDIEYLTSGFEYFSGEFAQEVDQTKHKID